MKEAVAYDDASFLKVPPFMSSSKNWDIIRYDDVMMFKAEALIEPGRQNEALPLINQLRMCAGNSTAFLKQAHGNATSHYGKDTYKPGINCNWTQSYGKPYALKGALNLQRKVITSSTSYAGGLHRI